MLKPTLFIASVLTALSMSAQTSARQEVEQNILLTGSNRLAYIDPVAPLTKTPKGYEPFYLSHYGRHGSRWLISEGDYKKPITTLRRAKAAGCLTPLGEETLSKLEAFLPTTVKRLGDLTTVGERQHHRIGKRLAEHFPEIFCQKNSEVDARSTTVNRCILSMIAECEELTAANPKLRIHNDVSESLQYYLNAPHSSQLKEASKLRNPIDSHYRKQLVHPERLCSTLFTDPAFVRDSIKGGELMQQLFNLAANMQSHDTDIELYSLFTTDECYDLWKLDNIGWYMSYGPAPQTKNIMQTSQNELLKNIISTADTITGKKDYHGATLRFGHEVCVLPLACLLELDSCGRQVEDLDRLDEQWVNYRIFPMGCNIQLVFYRPKGNKQGDILVKALLNEKEATLPVKTDSFPYYRWADLRRYYLSKIK